MALQSSGTISIQDIVDEFGGFNDHQLYEYYRGGYVPGGQYQPSSTTYYSSAFNYEVLYDDRDGSWKWYWNGVIVSTTSASAVLTGGWRYIRGSKYDEYRIDGGNKVGIIDVGERYRIRRQRDINDQVPVYGTIKLSDFYGAFNP